MKKLWIAALIFAVFSLAACGGEAAEPTPTPAETPAPTPTPAPAETPAPTEEEDDDEWEPVVMPADFVYSMAADTHIQGLAVDTRGAEAILERTQFLHSAGMPTYTIVENPLGGNAIRLTNRDQNHYAVDLVTDEFDWDIANNAYRFTVRGTAQAGGTVVFGGADSPWTQLFTAEADFDGSFTIEGIITAGAVAAAGDRGWFRIQANNQNPLTLYEITVVFLDSADNLAAHMGEGIETSTGPYVFNFTPDEQAAAEAHHFAGIVWEDRGPYTQWQWGFRPAGGDHGGDGYVIRGMRVGGDPRTDAYYVAQRNNLTIEFPNPLQMGVEYELSAWIFVPSDDTAGLADGFGNVRDGKAPNFAIPSFLVNQTAGSGAHTFQMSAQGRVPLDTWYQMTATLVYWDELIESIAIRFHVNDWVNYPDVWYVDSFSIAPR